MSAYDRIYDIVRQIPPGTVATYGQVATLAQMPGRARLVGYALYRVDMQRSDVPWHRVVNARGTVSHSPARRGTDFHQQALLEAEGVRFSDSGTLDLNRYQWRSPL